MNASRTDPPVDSAPSPENGGLFPTPRKLLREASPGDLYHYTDQHGLLGILRTGTLWATAIRYLNDTQEYQTGLSRIAAELQARIGQDAALGELLASSIDLSSWISPTVGVISFSEVRDDLGQWRAYSGGSGGYGIGLNGFSLMRQINAGLGALVRVVYGDASHSEQHEQIIACLCDEMIAAAQTLGSSSEDRQAFARRCNMSVQVVCSILKDWAFHAEAEWRGIVLYPAGERVKLRVRAGKSTLVPYYEVSVRDDAQQVNRLPITEVLVGPNPHPELARQAVLTALSLNSEVRPVDISKVPFRDW